MDKTAQKMKWTTRKREKWSPTGQLEEYFKPEFKEVMESLRLGDDNIRSIIAGEQLGDGDPGKDHISMKKLLDDAKSNLNRREYVTALACFSRFHAKLREVVKVLGEINTSLNKVHHRFLFEDLGDEHKPHIEDLEKRWEKAAAEAEAEFIKAAGPKSYLLDLYHNLTNERAKSLRTWESKYPNKVKDLKAGLNKLLEAGKKTLADILSNLKELGSLRATRKPEEYMVAAKKGLINTYNNFDKLFQSLYNGPASGKGFSLKQLVSEFKTFQPVPKEEAKQMGEQEIPAEKEKEKETMKIKTDIGPDIETNVSVPPKKGPLSHLSMPPMPTAPGGGPPSSGQVATDKRPGAVQMEDPHLPYARTSHPPFSLNQTVVPTGSEAPPAGPSPSAHQHGLDLLNKLQTPVPTGSGVVPNQLAPSIPAKPPVPSMTPEAFEQEGGHNLARVMRGDQPTMVSNTHANFFNSLQKMSDESPLLLASFISKYARKIQATDPTTAVQLLNIVKRIKG